MRQVIYLLSINVPFYTIYLYVEVIINRFNYKVNFNQH